MKVLVTSTSFQDTPGKHQEKLNSLNLELVYLRGPLDEATMLEVIDQYDALVCGDDELTADVLKKGRNSRLRFISKYGVGLDKIDLDAAKSEGIPVTNCPGVNQVSVSEHVFALLLSYMRNIPAELNFVQNEGKWKRLTGNEISGKNMLIMGLGKIGKEIARRAVAFDLNVFVYDVFYDEEYIEKYGLTKVKSLFDEIDLMDIISLNMPLLPETHHILSAELIAKLSKNACIINTARGNLVDQNALVEALNNNQIKGYLTDVLDVEPMPEDHPLRKLSNVFITPHIGSRTFESVEKQGTMAVENLIKGLNLA